MAKRHQVAAGECLSSIAFHHGLKAETIWNHPENAELRRQRPNLYQLIPGDMVFIPDLQLRTESIQTARRHQFQALNAPEKLRIQLKDEGAQPRFGLPYRLTVDDKVHEGTTDAEGRIRVFIPPDAARAVLAVEGPDGAEEYDLPLGYDRPAEHTSHLLSMLRRAGFLGDADDIPSVIEALCAYQGARGLEVTGDADRATLVALQDEMAEQV
jgi:hypothetical protein